MEDTYSLWVMPPEGPVLTQLTKEINTLSKQYNTPSFPPHVTLLFLGGTGHPEAKVLEVAQQLAAQIKKYPITFLNVSRGSTYYQCVYLLCAKEPATLGACTTARQMFGMPTDAPYMPHLSLLYGDITPEVQAEVAAAAVQHLYGDTAGYDTLLTGSSFLAQELAVWYTPTGDSTLQSWRQVARFPLA